MRCVEQGPHRQSKPASDQRDRAVRAPIGGALDSDLFDTVSGQEFDRVEIAGAVGRERRSGNGKGAASDPSRLGQAPFKTEALPLVPHSTRHACQQAPGQKCVESSPCAGTGPAPSGRERRRTHHDTRINGVNRFWSDQENLTAVIPSPTSAAPDTNASSASDRYDAATTTERSPTSMSACAHSVPVNVNRSSIRPKRFFEPSNDLGERTDEAVEAV